MRFGWVMALVAGLLGSFVWSAGAEARLNIRVDLAGQRMTVTTPDGERFDWTISSGRDGYRTPRGSYRPQRLERSWVSRKYGGAMPYAIFFHGGYAIHGTGELGRLGNPASHGCIRLHPAQAAKLFALVRRHGMASTRIAIEGTVQDQPTRYAGRAERTRAAAAARGSRVAVASAQRSARVAANPGRELRMAARTRGIETRGIETRSPRGVARYAAPRDGSRIVVHAERGPDWASARGRVLEVEADPYFEPVGPVMGYRPLRPQYYYYYQGPGRGWPGAVVSQFESGWARMEPSSNRVIPGGAQRRPGIGW